MKTQSEIENRIRYLLSEALDRQVKEASRRLPVLCKHNYQHSLDTRRLVHGELNSNFNRITTECGDEVAQKIGLCFLGSEDPEQWGGTICDDPIDAQKCPYFNPLTDKM